MERYIIPRNIKVKEIVAYGLNSKQITYLVVGMGGAVALWSSGIPSFGIAENIAGSMVCIGGGFALSLTKVKGQELDRYLYNTARYPLRTKEFEGGNTIETKKTPVYTIRCNI